MVSILDGSKLDFPNDLSKIFNVGPMHLFRLPFQGQKASKFIAKSSVIRSGGYLSFSKVRRPLNPPFPFSARLEVSPLYVLVILRELRCNRRPWFGSLFLLSSLSPFKKSRALARSGEGNPSRPAPDQGPGEGPVEGPGGRGSGIYWYTDKLIYW